MNVYDFDKTIFDGDCSMDFYFYNLKRHPAVLKALPIQAYGTFLYWIKRIEKTEFKQMNYRYFQYLKNIDEDISLFWEKNISRIKPWYLDQKREDDVIISASPEFLVKPVTDKLNIKLIGSLVDKVTGEYDGMNCYHEEKVIRFRELYNLSDMDAFYSDSKSDQPMAKFAKKAFMVKGDLISPWEF